MAHKPKKFGKLWGLRFKFWNKLYRYSESRRSKMLHERFTNIPDGWGFTDVKNGSIGGAALDDPEGTKTPLIQIIPIEVEIRKNV